MGSVVRAEFGRQQAVPETKGERVSAEVEDGYTRTANELQKAKCRLRMAGREHCVLEAVIYATYGWNKKRDRLTNTYLAELCDMDPSDINKALQILAKRNIIHLQKSGHMKLVGVNKVVSEWVYKRETGEGSKKNTGNSTQNPGDSTQNAGCFHPSNQAETPNTQDSLTQDSLTKDSKRSSSRPADAEQDTPSQPALPDDAVIHAKQGKRTVWGTKIDLQLAQQMATGVQAIQGEHYREPNWAAWANEIRLMRERDQRDARHIEALFTFANQDGFWAANVLSPDALRRNWGKLAAAWNNQRSGRRPGALSNLAANQQRAKAMQAQGRGLYDDDTPL